MKTSTFYRKRKRFICNHHIKQDMVGSTWVSNRFQIEMNKEHQLYRFIRKKSKKGSQIYVKLFEIIDRLEMEEFHNEIHRQHVVERIVLHLIRYDPIFKLPYSSCDPTYIQDHYKKAFDILASELGMFLSIKFSIEQSYEDIRDRINKVIKIKINTTWSYSIRKSRNYRHNSSYFYYFPFQELVDNIWIEKKPRKSLSFMMNSDETNINNAISRFSSNRTWYYVVGNYFTKHSYLREQIRGFRKDTDLGYIIDNSSMFTDTIENKQVFLLKIEAIKSYLGDVFEDWFKSFELEIKVLSLDETTIHNLLSNLVINKKRLSFRLYNVKDPIIPNSFLKLPISQLVFSGMKIDKFPNIEELTSLERLVFINCKVSLPFMKNSKLSMIKFIRCKGVKLITKPDFPMLEIVLLIDGDEKIDFIHPNRIVVVPNFDNWHPFVPTDHKQLLFLQSVLKK